MSTATAQVVISKTKESVKMSSQVTPPPIAGSSTSSSSQKPASQPPLASAVYCWPPPVHRFQFFQ